MKDMLLKKKPQKTHLLQKKKKQKTVTMLFKLNLYQVEITLHGIAATIAEAHIYCCRVILNAGLDKAIL